LAALESPRCLYQLYYQQSRGPTSIQSDGKIIQLPTPSLSLAFDDTTLESVHQAWQIAIGINTKDRDEDYMVFSDREGGEQYDDDE
jgi:hypothetical protein